MVRRGSLVAALVLWFLGFSWLAPGRKQCEGKSAGFIRRESEDVISDSNPATICVSSDQSFHSFIPLRLSFFQLQHKGIEKQDTGSFLVWNALILSSWTGILGSFSVAFCLLTTQHSFLSATNSDVLSVPLSKCWSYISYYQMQC